MKKVKLTFGSGRIVSLCQLIDYSEASEKTSYAIVLTVLVIVEMEERENKWTK